MSESKILNHFFEEQRQKYKKKVHSILHSALPHQDLHPYDSEWLRRKAEIESLSFHPFEIEPRDINKLSKSE
jgi:hypothetical protein